jgi:hypothetical protein
MKTSSAKNKTSKKRSTADADHAMKIAFEELRNRADAENKAARQKQRAEKWKKWQGAAKRFKGLSEALRLEVESRNIQVQNGGYRVRFLRRGETFTGHFPGVTDESLAKAIRFRDEATKILGERSNSIPSRVLNALGLPAPVPGIIRKPTQSAYMVLMRNGGKAVRRQRFSFEFLTEEDAYAAAIECVEAQLKSK